MSDIKIWLGPNGISLPASANDAKDIVPYASYLSVKQQERIISAFNFEAYDMAAEYSWKKAMIKLKETISTLGMKFIGEMIGRDDLEDTSSIDSIITDYTAIQLAEQLGVIGSTAALRLRQSNELISHFFSKNSQDEIDYPTAFTIVKASIQYILGEQDISIALEFSKFRDRLLSETLNSSDHQVEQIINSPLFYLRTVVTILLSSIKNDIGAKLEHSLGNLNLLIPNIWGKLAENDKWHIGTAYRDVTASGNAIAASGIKSALLKVNGFDFVPESLRSLTFIKTAKQVIEAHFAFNNFYNEPPIVRKLANLGTTIPSPALAECMQAYLAIYLGNPYGVSHAAVPIAEEQLSKITKERWIYYLEKILKDDEVILLKLNNSSQINRLAELLIKNKLNDLEIQPRKNAELYKAIIVRNYEKAIQISRELYQRIKE